MKQYVPVIKIISSLLLTLLFLIDIVEFVELYILCKPKEKCWPLFIGIMALCGLACFAFYTFIWQACVKHAQKTFHGAVRWFTNSTYVY
jgi:hypothetical protein